MKNNTTAATRRAVQRAMKRAADRLDRDGCSRCGARPYHGVAYLLTSREVVCQHCARNQDKPTAVMGIQKEPPGKADDKAFFAANPDAPFRIRNPFPGEVTELNARNFALAAMMGWSPQICCGDTIVTVQEGSGPMARVLMSLAGVPPEDREGYVAQFVSDYRAELKQAADFYEEMPPRERWLVENASTTLAMDRLLYNGRLLEGMRKQGAAMCEGRNATKQ
jgi:hypothetical protein